jgi:hypothetical protein
VIFVSKKEKAEKDLVIRIQPSLFRTFKSRCKGEGRTVSETVRELMKQYIDKEDISQR